MKIIPDRTIRRSSLLLEIMLRLGMEFSYQLPSRRNLSKLVVTLGLVFRILPYWPALYVIFGKHPPKVLFPITPLSNLS